jgi:inosose dehydratase
MKTTSRRQFIHTTSSLLATTALIGNAVSGASIENTKRRINLGIQLYSLREFSLEAALDHAKQIGFTQVEFYSKMLPIDSTAEQIADVRKKVADRGLSISAHGVNKFSNDEVANRKLFEFAKAVGIPTITADPDPDSFSNLNALVKEFDIRVAIHNHGPKHRYNKAIDVLHAVEKYDPRIGACADLGHYIRSGERPTEVIRLLQGRLYGIHLKDFAEMKDNTKGVILGKGHLDCQGEWTRCSQLTSLRTVHSHWSMKRIPRTRSLIFENALKSPTPPWKRQTRELSLGFFLLCLVQRLAQRDVRR